MYIFYDLETTDTDPDFGQILQIGVIVADDDLNILQTHSLRARRQPWVIPSPRALLITGITPDQLENPDETTLFESMRAFDAILRGAGHPLTTAGYNSMKFDEAGIASAFHQNLLTPGLTTQREGGAPRNARLDVINLVRACLIHKPGFLRLDEKTSGGNVKTTLGAVARQNGVALSEDDAHEAVGDIRATIGMAKLVRDGAPEIWDQMMNLATPEGVEDFIASHDIFCHSDMFYGKPRSRIATGIDGDTAFDLSLDPALYTNKTAAELAAVMQQKHGNPFINIEKAKQPVLMPESLTPRNLYPAGIDQTVLEARAAAIRNNPDFRARVAQAAAINAHNTTPQEIEKQTGEAIPADIAPLLEAWKQEFQNGDWPRRAALIQEFPVRFAEALKATPDLNRFVQFARRIVFDNAPEQMTPTDRARYKAAIDARIMDPDPPEGMVTTPGARAEIGLLRKELDEGTSTLLEPGDDIKLDALELYYNALEAKYAPAPPPAPAANNGPSP